MEGVVKMSGFLSFLVSPVVAYTRWDEIDGAFMPTNTVGIDKHRLTGGVNIIAVYNALKREFEGGIKTAVLVRYWERRMDSNKTVRQMSENFTAVRTILKIIGFKIFLVSDPAYWQDYAGVSDDYEVFHDIKRAARTNACRLYPDYAKLDWEYRKSESLLIGHYAVNHLDEVFGKPAA